MIKNFEDPDLGIVKVVYNVRAKRVIARRRSGEILLTVPHYYDSRQIQHAFSELKSSILALIPPKTILFTPGTQLISLGFELKISEHDLTQFYVTLKDKILSVACPQNTNFADTEVQQLIRINIEKALRMTAKDIIPDKVKELSLEHGFIYNLVKINKSRSRWGSCSFQKDINISYFCMLLPNHLVDFIILHELCHTIEMNHGTNFWKLLDQVTDNNAKKLTRELNATSILW